MGVMGNHEETIVNPRIIGEKGSLKEKGNAHAPGQIGVSAEALGDAGQK